MATFDGERLSDGDDDPSFVIELLNARETRRRGAWVSDNARGRGTRETESFIREMATVSEASGAGKDYSPGWDRGGTYGRAAKATGVDLGGTLAAGADAERVFEFVSNYRKEEGEQLGLLDERNLKFATSRVLHIPPPPISDTIQARQEAIQPSGVVVPGDRMERTPTGRGVRQRRKEDDGAETARLCDELLRWSATSDGAERKQGHRGDVGKGMRTGSDDGRVHTTSRVLNGNTDAQWSASPRGHHSDRQSSRENVDISPDHSQGDFARVRQPSANSPPRNTRHSRQRRITELDDHQDQNSSFDSTAEWEAEQSGEMLAYSPRRHGGEPRKNAMGNGHLRPTPSYALPTKHFKSTGRDRGDALYVEDINRKKQMQRQAHLEEENAALKLRLEGQRRAIHELEHQSNTLREEARIREEEFSRVKRKLYSMPHPVAGGKCSCCASTHHARITSTGESGASVLKKRALAAETRTQVLERQLLESRAKELRGREIVATLKHSHSGSQDQVARLEAELEIMGKTLSGAKRELADTRRDMRMRMKDTRKHRRQQGERTRETEVARAETAELLVQLRQARKETDRVRLEVVALREENAKAETRANDLIRENRMLQDRLSDRSYRKRVRERDRWILSELRSESGSPIRGSSRLSGEEGIRENGLPAPLNKTGKANMPAQGPLFSRSPNGASRPKERNGGRRTRQGEAGEVSTWNVGSPTRHCSRSTFTQARPVSGSDSGKELRSEYHQLPSSDGPHVGKLDRAGGLVGDDPKARHRRDRQLSMRSADEAREIGSGGLALGSSTPSAGSAPSALGARYERLQAMYRRVNRRDAGVRGRSGVG